VTRIAIVADSGATMAKLTAAVTAVKGAHIVRYGNSRTRLERLLAPAEPDVVVIGDLHTAAGALVRLAEIAGTAPAAKVVLLGDGQEVRWLPDALRARAAAVLPGNIEARVLAVVLGEVIAERAATPVPLRPYRPRAQEIERTHEGQAA
jgi:DNA-binding NarL/FixJ family response regulator